MFQAKQIIRTCEVDGKWERLEKETPCLQSEWQTDNDSSDKSFMQDRQYTYLIYFNILNDQNMNIWKIYKNWILYKWWWINRL